MFIVQLQLILSSYLENYIFLSWFLPINLEVFFNLFNLYEWLKLALLSEQYTICSNLATHSRMNSRQCFIGCNCCFFWRCINPSVADDWSMWSSANQRDTHMQEYMHKNTHKREHTNKQSLDTPNWTNPDRQTNTNICHLHTHQSLQLFHIQMNTYNIPVY